jgi:phenylpyruvate tautomerase PptA (4-oxalocrotonate tautomerase family)
MIDITTSRNALSDAAKVALADRLSTDLIELEGAEDNAFVRSITWCFIDERDDVFVGGRRFDRPIYRVVVTVPEGVALCGPLGLDNRRSLVKRVTDAVLEAEGTTTTTVEAARVWVQMRQIADAHWGAFGELVSMPDIVAYGVGVGHTDSVGLRIREALTTHVAPPTSVMSHHW